MPAILALTPLAAVRWLPSVSTLLDAPAPARERSGGIRVILYLKERVEQLPAILDAISAASGAREHSVLVVDEGDGGEAAADGRELKARGVVVRRHATGIGPALSMAEGAGLRALERGLEDGIRLAFGNNSENEFSAFCFVPGGGCRAG